MIGILDYGLGNVLAFVNTYKRLHFQARVVQSESDLKGVTRLILPGVGAFDRAMLLFNESSLRAPVERLVLEREVPVLGVCVGMQMLAASSEEGESQGLGWVKGTVKRIVTSTASGTVRLPHMGWNDIEVSGHSSLFRGLETNARFYFLHSYYFDAQEEGTVLACVEYGKRLVCAVRKGQIFGVQFHPEKSHGFGARLLQNFAES
jgi:glutamine amidotransferase